jgi:hypothetical protein
MTTHLAAFWQNTFGLSLAEINVVQDDILTKLTATRFAVPSDYNTVYWAASSSVLLSRAQIRTPTLQVRRISGEIIPRRQSSPLFNLNNLDVFRPLRPISLTATEDFEVLQSDTSVANASHYGLVALGPPPVGDLPPGGAPSSTVPGLPKPPVGDIRIVRMTASSTLTQGAWVTTSPVPDLALEPGQYTLIGFLPISANCIAARALITQQVYRPGVLGLAGTEAVAADFDWKSMYDIIGYDMGSFNHLNIPQFQFLADAADTAEVVYMYVIRTGSALGLSQTPAGP